MPRMRGPAPRTFPQRDTTRAPLKRKLDTNAQAPISASEPKRLQRSSSFISIPSSSDEDEAPKSKSSSRAEAKSPPQQPRSNKNTMANFLAMGKQKPSQILQQRPQQTEWEILLQRKRELQQEISELQASQQAPQRISRQIPQQVPQQAKRTTGSIFRYPAYAYVEMKINALVMLKINLDTEKGLVNGSQGIVVGWEPHDPAKLPNTKKNTLLNIDVLAGHHAHWRANLIREYAERRGIRQWPIVRFNNGITRTIYPWGLVNTLGATEPYSILYRTQLPLVLAWAVSIHKSQGMTLTHVTTDLSQAWEQPLKYVALSRVTSLDGLAILKPGGWKKRVSRKESLNVIESSSHEVREFLEDKFGRDLFTELEGNR
ncbi:ATP-dependent DNA helicase PIF1 [Fusarium proliferatum]|nr:ATP-dependent DNA helicase PIF1 [Fusarium proliferatum]KAG4268099.1 ATP-dependent DNA helicase PIF1 [Fusarium proliferatum]